MKKVLALVLALIMVCTMAMAATNDDFKSIKLGDEKTTTLEGKFDVLKMEDNTSILANTEKKVTLTTHENDVKVTTDDETITKYYADRYTVVNTTYYAVDSSAATHKLVNNGKVVAFLATDTNAATTTAAVSKVVKYAKGDKLTCGDYDVDGATTDGKADADTTVYVIGDKAYEAGGNDWAVLNGKFVKYNKTDAGVQLIKHNGFKINTMTSTASNAKIATIKCGNCDKVINVIDKIPADSAAKYTKITFDNVAYYYYLTADVDVTAAPAATTNPDTGANDVIGVAAALAVVALVSGAAISLKK